MIPSPWVGVVLALAAYRVARIVGWDDLPPLVRLRAWVTGETWQSRATSNSAMGLTAERPEVVAVYRRPTVAHWIGCPFCQGFWVAVAVYLAWVFEPRWTLYVLAPFALSAAVGLIAKNLDP